MVINRIGIDCCSWMRSSAVACCFVVMTSLTPATAEIAWMRRSGAWQVSLYNGARGDAWCSWLTGWEDVSGLSQRTLSLQIREDEVILFLFLLENLPVQLEEGTQAVLIFDNHQAKVKIDVARRYPNGFNMLRGVLARGVDAQKQFATAFANSSTAQVMIPGGNTWSLDSSGRLDTLPYMQQCMQEVEARSKAR